MHVALRGPDRHTRDARDLLVGQAGDVAEYDGEALIRGEAGQRCGQLPALLGEERSPRRVALLTGGFVVERERLGLTDALARKAIAAGVHDQAVKPGGELRLAAELAEPGAELHERLLRGIPRLLEVAHDLRGEPVHARGMPLDKGVERPSVAVLCLADEVHVAELPVCVKPSVRRLTIDLTRRRGGWLHGPVSVVPRMADALTPEIVEPLLSGRFGRPYLYEASCESTQRLLGSDHAEGAAAVCDVQTGGRGRLGRSWIAPPGTAVLCSVVLEPPADRSVPELSLVGGVAVAETIEAATALAAQIKWPNDVLINRRKVAGVLAEASEGRVVLGMGLNVNQSRDELPPDATVAAGSLLTIDGVRRERAPILADLLLRLERAYDRWREGGLNAIYDGLGARDFLRGRRLLVDGESGVGVAIDRSGRLEVAVGHERRVVESGEVLFER